MDIRLDPPDADSSRSRRLAAAVNRRFAIGLTAARVLSVAVLGFILVQMSDINSSISESQQQAEAAFLLTGSHTGIASFVFATDQGIRAGALAEDTLATIEDCRIGLLDDAEIIDAVVDDPDAEAALRKMVLLNLEVFDLLEEATIALADGEAITARSLSSLALVKLDSATAAANDLAAVRIDTASDQAEAATTSYERTRNAIIVVGLIAIAAASAIHVWMRRGVSSQVLAIQTLHDETARRAQDTIAAQNHVLATMSHEIRTPPNGLLGLLASLDTDDLPADARQTIQMARRSGQDLLVLADDMLDVVSLDTGNVAIAGGEVRPADLIQGTLDLLRPAAAARRVELTASVHPDVPAWVVTDATRVRQVLSNLVGNAVKHTELSSVVVTVACSDVGGATADATRATHLRFAVIDDGPGILAESQSRIFERFTTASAFPAATRGSGLGLAISRELVELLGGRIGVRSADGMGSTFWFTVPLEASARPADVEATTTEAAGDPAVGDGADVETEAVPAAAPTSDGSVEVPAPARRSLKVLVAEDDTINTLVITAMLERLGHQVTTVTDGARAISAVRSQHFDLVLMDIQMPVLDGKEATRVIRSLPAPEGLVPIVAVTADVMPHQIAEIAAIGVDLHVGKPFTIAQLDGAVQTAVVLDARDPEHAAATGR